MKKRVLKKSKVLREGYIKGLKKARSIIESMVSRYAEGFGPEGPLPDQVEVLADGEWNAIYQAECFHEYKVVSFDSITYEDYDEDDKVAIIKGVVWGAPLH